MNIKKLTLSLGSIVTIAAPVAAVVSCGQSSSEYPESDLLKMSNLKSSEAESKLQDLWLAKVLKSVYKIDTEVADDSSVAGGSTHVATNLDILTNLNNTTSNGSKDFEEDFKGTLIWVLKNKAFASKDALSGIYQSLKSNAPDSVIYTKAGSEVEKSSVKALNEKVYDRSEVNTKVDGIFKTGSTDNDQWKDIFYNITKEGDQATFNPSILGVKDLILKMMVTKAYLSLSETEYKTSLPDEFDKVDSKFKDNTLIDPSEAYFPLMISTMNSRLAYETTIELDEAKSKEFIVSNLDNELEPADAANVFDFDKSKFNKVTTSSPEGALPHSIKSETRVDEILARIPSIGKTTADKTLGFKGLSSLPSGKDSLNTDTASAIKLASAADSRDGFVITDDSKTEIVKETEKVKFTDDDKTKVQLHYYTSLMPIYDTTDKTLEFKGFDFEHLDILLDEVYTKDSSLFSAATKYFTQRDEAIKLTVDNDWARNYYVNQGLTFIDDEK